MCLKTIRLTAISNRSKRTVSASGGGLRLLQMVSKPGIGRCVSKDVGPSKEVDYEIPHRLEKGTKHSL